MRRARIVAAMALAAVLVTEQATAGANWPPVSYQLVRGTQGSGDPIDQLGSDDSDYMEVEAKLADGVYKVIYKVTFDLLTSNDDTISIEWSGRTEIENECRLDLFAYAWKRKRFLRVATFEPIDDGGDTMVAVPREDATRFLNANGKFRVKALCDDDEGFTLNTDQIKLVV